MRRLYFTNRLGESVLIDSNNPPLLLSKLEGVGGAPAIIQMEKAPYQDGSTYIDTVLEPRYLTIEGMIWSTHTAEVMERRRKLVRVLNPRLGPGTLRLEFDSVVREIEAVAETSPVFPDKGRKPMQQFIISLVCPDPAWRSDEEETWTLASFIGGFSLPFSFPLSFGTVGQTLDVENYGDLESPVFIRMIGPLKNPVLENVTTGQRISITREILEGESLEINTAFGKKSVTIIDSNNNRSNAFHYVSPDSEFWQMVPGLNTVSYAATEESSSSAVTISFYHRYAGV